MRRPAFVALLGAGALAAFLLSLMAGKVWIAPLGLASGTPEALVMLELRLPRALWPIPQPYGHVIAFTDDGKVVADLQDPSGAYPETTAITETADRLYVQSLHAHGLGWLPNKP